MALEVALGLSNVEVNARLKAINYCHKLSSREGNELVKLAYLQQKEWAEQGLSCWGLQIKRELDKNGLGFVWGNPSVMPRKMFGQITKQRLQDVKFQDNVSKLKEFTSARYLSGIEPNRVIPCKRIQRIKSEYRRRSFLKVLFEAHEDLICRESAYRTCRDCGEILEFSVLKHRLFFCSAVKDIAKSLNVSVSYKIGRTELITLALSKLEEKGGYRWAKLIESVHEA